MKKKTKSEKQKQMSVEGEKESTIQQVLNFSKKRFKKFDEVIHQLYAFEDLSSFFSDRRIWKIKECFNHLSSKGKVADRTIFRDVLIHLHGQSTLVSTEEKIHIVYRALQFRVYWINDVFEWQPRSRNCDLQVREFVSYLFCKYKIPGFLYKAFHETGNDQYIYWLIHLGMGGKVRDLGNIPIPFTRRMGHYFLQAPAQFSITEALRWSQVKGLNGDDKLADRIAYSWLGTKPYDSEDFWESFLRLLVRGGMFNRDKMTELIDYVREVKREDKNYSLKGRTLQSLVRQSDVWHKRYTQFKSNFSWKPCGIQGYVAEKKMDQIVFEELTESRRLAEEGKAMKHCVSSYSYYCEKGKSAIFSIRRYSGNILLETVATIEVNLTLKRIVQAKGKMNRPISEDARKHLEVWAFKEGLEINRYL